VLAGINDYLRGEGRYDLLYLHAIEHLDGPEASISFEVRWDIKHGLESLGKLEIRIF
jgi:hypothetical protein